MNPVADLQRKKPAIRAFKGLAGSPTARISKPKPKDLVLLHFCFNQEAGESKRESCSCKERIPRLEALDLVRQRVADWLLIKNRKTSKLVPFTRAVVVRQTVIDGEVLWAVAPPAKTDRRSEKHENIKRTIRCDARKIFEKLFSKGLIPPETFKVTDDELDQMFEDKEGFTEFLTKLAELGQNRLRSKLVGVIVHWWNNVLGYHKLNVSAGILMNQAGQGKGPTIYSKGSKQIELIEAMSQRFMLATADFRKRAQINPEPIYQLHVGRQVTGANERASKWCGSWDFTTGTDPVRWERPEEDDDFDRFAWTADPMDHILK